MKKITLTLTAILLTLFAGATVPRRASIPDIPGYKTLKGDFHIHTNFSDANVWPVTRIDEADFDGLDFVSITDHLETRHQHMIKDFGANVNRNSSYQIAAKAAKKYGILVIHGAELTRGSRIFPGHFNTHFITDADLIAKESEAKDGTFGDDITAQEETGIKAGLKEARRQGAFIVWNHPDWEQQAPNVTKWWPIHTELFNAGLMDGIEIVNRFSGFDPEAFHWAMEKDLAIVTGTDAHKPMFQCVDYEKGEYRPMTLVFAKDKSIKSIREALEARRTVAFADRCLYGKAEWLESLFKACLEVTDIKYSEKKVTMYLRNNSSIPITLTKAPGGEKLTYSRLLYINEEEELSIGINGPDSRYPIGQDEFDVYFYVANWFTDVDTPLKVSFHVTMPDKFKAK